MGLNTGEIAVGRRGDVIVVDREYEVNYTIVGGRILYYGKN